MNNDIGFRTSYNKDKDLVIFQIGGFCLFSVPFDFVRMSYYETKKIREKVRGAIVLSPEVEESIINQKLKEKGNGE